MLPLVGAAATAGVKYFMNKKQTKETTAGSTNDSFLNAGIPDQLENYDHAQLENAKMVSEGSQFGVQYFNESAEEEIKELSNKITE